ncbi:MAG TPA: hypothetical protein VK489_09930 [Ferruginibacter sp.]|nr:hypothetical protein [Ferruginibacter sp.]
MNIGYKSLPVEQRSVAIQRLTALWAFAESGLGGILHALQIPFTGLIVGGMAVIIISFIAGISERNYKQILKSAVIVLIVKAMVSPHTPFPAYIAVSFQAFLGYALFSILRVNLVSIFLLSTIAMMESAIQKLLILTLFFGRSLWNAADEMMDFIATQFGTSSVDGSRWIIGSYLFIYLIGGFIIGWITYRIIKGFASGKASSNLENAIIFNTEVFKQAAPKRTFLNKLWGIILVLVVLSVILFVFAPDAKQGWVAVLRTISWTMAVILLWYMVARPVFTKLIQKLLRKKESRYSDEVLKVLSFLPVLRQLTALAWEKSKLYSGREKWQFFFSAFIHWSLTYSDNNPEMGLKKMHEHNTVLKTDT